MQSALPNILVIGFSHLSALIAAHEARVRAGRQTSSPTFILPNRNQHYQPWARRNGTEIVYNGSLIANITRHVISGPDLIIVSLWGNQHSSLSAARHDRPFDFVLPTEPQLDIDPEAEIVPFDLIRARLILRFDLYHGLLNHITSSARCPVLALAAPPPIGPVEQTNRGTGNPNLDIIVQRNGIAPAHLRLKFWKTCLDLHDGLPAQYGIRVLPPPPGTADADGYRLKRFWGLDWLHGNPAYGEEVWAQIDHSIVDERNAA